MSKNLIELNGNTYDTRTGEIVQESRTSNTKSTPQESSPKNLDGFSRRKPLPHNANRTQPGKSKTLMRTAVEKPGVIADKQPSTNTPQKLQKRGDFMNIPRFERAAKITKSEAIKKFNLGSQHTVFPQASVTQSQQTEQQQQSRNYTDKAQAPEANRRQTPQQHAIEQAKSHEQSFDSGTRSIFGRIYDTVWDGHSAVRYGVISVAVLIVLFFSVQIATPTVSVRVASNRAGIPAKIPEYKPSGFVLSESIEYSPGQVSLQYQSVSDTRNFRIKKQQTEWSNEDLRTSHVEEKGLYQTVSENGKTIYLYNETNATWIEGGIWYTIEGASGLSSDQLLRIANGL